jgi:hypothetical protein
MSAIGYVCAGLAVTLLAVAIMASGGGGSGGMAPLGLALALLLGAVLLIGEGEKRA